MEPPGQVGPYRIERRLGAGGMGVVYLGRDAAGTAAAVKLIRPEFAADAAFRARLRREVAAAAQVPRFCTAPVLGADLDSERPWVATEFIDGPTLDVAVLEHGRLSGAALEAFAAGVAVALRAIHQYGVVHRDLKPSNILLSPLGPRVIDFGIARIEEVGTELTQLTQVGSVVGTPAYMAPEQLRGEPVTPAMDVFAWASLVWYAATGRPPFGTGEPAMAAILAGRPDLGELAGVGVAEPLRGLVTAALHQEPTSRPSAAELVDRLAQGAASQTTQVLATAAMAGAPAAPAPPPSARGGGSLRWWALAAGFVGVTVAAAVVGAVTLVPSWLDQDGTSASGDTPGGGAAPGAEPVTLRFISWGSEARHELTEQVIEEFVDQHDDIVIEAEFTDWDSYWDRLATVTAAGAAPDIMMQEERYLDEYARNNLLLDLDEVSGALDLSGVDELVRDSGVAGGVPFGAAAGVQAYALVADPLAFEDAGVAMPDDTTWTWEDYLAIAAEISAAGDAYGAEPFGANLAGFTGYARQQGESLLLPDGSPGFLTQTLADWWSLSLAQVANGGAPDPSSSVEIMRGPPSESLLATNEGAMGFWWTSQLDALTEAAGRDLVLLRHPGEPTGPRMYVKPSMFYAISAETEHPEEAARFVDFLLNSDEAADIMLADRGLPANLTQRERVAGALPPGSQAAVEFLTGIAPELAGPPEPAPPEGAGEVPGIMLRLFEEVLFERLSPQEGAEQFVEELALATTG